MFEEYVDEFLKWSWKRGCLCWWLGRVLGYVELNGV